MSMQYVKLTFYWLVHVRHTSFHQGEIFKFKRPLISSDWHKVDEFSGRIRSLLLRKADRVASDVLEEINHYRGSQPLLPNLRRIHCSASSVSVVCCLAGPRLSHFSADIFSGGDSEGIASLRSLGHKSPSIETVSINFVQTMHMHEDDIQTFSEAVSELVCTLHNLRSIHCDLVVVPLDNYALVHLASLGALKQLHSKLRSDLTATSLSQHCFDHLQLLTMGHERLQPCIHLIQAMTSTCLKSLVIMVSEAPSSSLLKRLYWTLGNSPMQLSLTRISIKRGVSPPEPNVTDPSYIVHRETFRPVLDCLNLEIFVLDTNISFQEVGDALLRDMALAWPHLRKLYLGTPLGGRLSKVTPEGLFALAECPKLESFGIVFDASGYDSASLLRQSTGVCSKTMRTLIVGHSKITNVEQVVAILLAIFPNMENVITSTLDHPGEGGHRERFMLWDDVKRSIRKK
jgi:hypothetical protein